MWLPDNDDIARSTTIPVNVKSPDSILNRKLHVSQIYSRTDPTLPTLILSLIRKMMSSQTTITSMNQKTLLSDRSYIYVSSTGENQWCWKKPEGDDISFVFNNKVPSNIRAAYLLLDLGGGGDGRVWLAATTNDHACVLKFCDRNEVLEAEKKLWKELWNIDVKITTLMDQSVLVMPYMKPCM